MRRQGALPRKRNGVIGRAHQPYDFWRNSSGAGRFTHRCGQPWGLSMLLLPVRLRQPCGTHCCRNRLTHSMRDPARQVTQPSTSAVPVNPVRQVGPEKKPLRNTTNAHIPMDYLLWSRHLAGTTEKKNNMQVFFYHVKQSPDKPRFLTGLSVYIFTAGFKTVQNLISIDRLTQ